MDSSFPDVRAIRNEIEGRLKKRRILSRKSTRGTDPRTHRCMYCTLDTARDGLSKKGVRSSEHITITVDGEAAKIFLRSRRWVEGKGSVSKATEIERPITEPMPNVVKEIMALYKKTKIPPADVRRATIRHKAIQAKEKEIWEAEDNLHRAHEELEKLRAAGRAKSGARKVRGCTTTT